MTTSAGERSSKRWVSWLIPVGSFVKVACARLLSFVAALHGLTDKLLEGRVAAATKALEHPEKLKRPELRKKQERLDDL